MTKLYLFVFGVMVVLPQERVAVQDLMGTWQGVLRANGQDQRTVIKILKDDGGTLQGALYPIDQGAGYLPLTGTARGGNITLSVPARIVTTRENWTVAETRFQEHGLRTARLSQ